MEKSTISTFIIALWYPECSKNIYIPLRNMFSQHAFSSIVADNHGIPRELPSDTWSLTTTMDREHVITLVEKLVSSVSSIKTEILVLPRDEYFANHYR
jgi:hypothetical protein